MCIDTCTDTCSLQSCRAGKSPYLLLQILYNQLLVQKAALRHVTLQCDSVNRVPGGCAALFVSNCMNRCVYVCDCIDADVCCLSNHNFYKGKIMNLHCAVDMTVTFLLLQVRVATLLWLCLGVVVEASRKFINSLCDVARFGVGCVVGG